MCLFPEATTLTAHAGYSRNLAYGVYEAGAAALQTLLASEQTYFDQQKHDAIKQCLRETESPTKLAGTSSG